MRILRLLPPAASLLLAAITARAATDEDVAAATLTRVGDPAPTFAAQSITGETWDSAKLGGKVVVLSLFATWCPPCNAELPHIEKELWQAYRNRGLIVLAAAREEGFDKLQPFAKKLGLTFPLLTDPKREVFNKFARNFIPRLYVIGADGRIMFQTVGFRKDEFKSVVAAVERELAAIEAKK